MAAQTSLNESALDGNFKDQYGDGPVDVYPEQVKLQRLFKFQNADKRQGQYFIQDVQVGQSWGTTQGGSTANSFALASVVSGQLMPARIKGSQIIERERISYGVITRAQTDKQAFLTITRMPLFFLNRAAKTVLELMLLTGRTGLAKCASSVNGGGAGLTTVITITSDYWTDGIWSASENMPVQFFTASDVLVSSGGNSEVSVSAVDFANEKLTVTAPAGQSALITAIDNAISAEPDEVSIHHRAMGDVTNEMVGLHTIAGHTTGDLFNIDSDDWSVWRANVYDSSGTFTFDKLEKACAQLASRGTAGELILVCNRKTWATLANQNNALRKEDASYDKAKVDYGTQLIEYYTADGSVKIMSHMYCFQGFAYLFREDALYRTGSSDIIFSNPMNNEKFFFDVQDYAAVEMRTFCDQALFTDNLKACLRIENITN